jgi:hypothetical protein
MMGRTWQRFEKCPENNILQSAGGEQRARAEKETSGCVGEFSRCVTAGEMEKIICEVLRKGEREPLRDELERLIRPACALGRAFIQEVRQD